jgi:C1A family cysteine protease
MEEYVKNLIPSLGASVMPDPPDERDYRFYDIPDENRILNAASSLPSSVSWESEMTTPKYQGGLGSCVAFATCGLKEWQEAKEHKKEVEDGKEDHREQKEYNFSEQWIYWNCKKIDPWPNSEGTNFRSALKVLQQIGVPTEEAWPYSDDKFSIGKPEGWASLVARWATIGSYWNVGRGLQELKRALVEGPVLIAIPCFAEMYGYLEKGFVPYPKDPSKVYASHAILAVGYDDDKRIISIKNSWSQFWGRKGYGDFPYSYMEDFLGCAWVVKDITVTPEMLVGTRNLIE